MSSLLNSYRVRIENVLENLFAEKTKEQLVSNRLFDAMQYSTLGGGKRVRALLTYASGLATNAPLNKLDVVAAAIECIHAYSLIHDDLPAMDDDDLRRGKASNHIKFDEATAILAGDALLTLAFELLSSQESPLNDAQSRKIIHTLSVNAGANGMVGGQMLDILATNRTLNEDELTEKAFAKKELTEEELTKVHRNKTGALIHAAVVCGAYCTDALDSSQLVVLTNYANHIGLAFQVVDDILDIESSTDELGKTSGSDLDLGKSTYPSVLGLDQSKELAQTLYQQSMECIETIGDNSGLLTELADLVVNRTN